jgi:uncharacterized SAM-binding protein YcdF (DUF218 family)
VTIPAGAPGDATPPGGPNRASSRVLPGDGEPSPGGPNGMAEEAAPQPGVTAAAPSHASVPDHAARAAVPSATGSAPRPRRALRLLLLLAAPLALLLGFAAFVQAAIDPAAPPPGETDGIVVLTGGSERVATGFRLLAEGQARRLLISGAHPESSLAEIAAAAGIDPAPFAARVAIGHAAASTRGNAVETAAWAQAEALRSLRIVTAGYHMPRAMVELRRALPGLRLVEHPVPSAALRAPGALWRPQVWALLAGEYARYLGAWAGLSGAFAPRRESHAT